MSLHKHPAPKRRTDQPESIELSTADLFELFGDKYTRRVYAAVADQARCGRAVAETADVSRATAYRRLNELRDAGLVRTEMAVSESGHHRKLFKGIATSLSVSLDDGIDATVDSRADPGM